MTVNVSRINKALGAAGAALVVAICAGIARNDVSTWVLGLVNVIVVGLGTYAAPANTSSSAPPGVVSGSTPPATA